MLKVKSSGSKLPALHAQMKERTVKAGILKSAGKHDGSKKGLSVATIATFNEYGTATAPERPAFRASFSKNRKKYKKALGKLGTKSFNSESTLAGMNKLGREAKKDIQKSIVSGGWTANAESTQKQKGRGFEVSDGVRKKGKSNQRINRPLIGKFGQVLDSVDYEIN